MTLVHGVARRVGGVVGRPVRCQAAKYCFQSTVLEGLRTRFRLSCSRCRSRRVKSIPKVEATGCSAEPEIADSSLPVNVEHSNTWERCLINQRRRLVLSVAFVVSVHTAVLVWPGVVHASSGALSASALEVFKQWLQYVDSLGNWGPVLFIATVAFAEMVPLLPTQPIALASGLLFGPLKGTFLILIGVTVAAINAFLISRGIGKSLAKKVIAAEVGESGGAGSGGILQSKLAEVQQAIASGSFMQQFVAVILLRLTPVVPYSASNYILGLTPLQFPPFVLGTAVGMSVWSLLYASLGGASRALLTSGVSFNVIFTDLAERAGGYTQNIALAAVGVGVVIAVFWVVSTLTKDDPPKSDAPPSSGGESGASDNATVELVQEQVVTRK